MASHNDKRIQGLAEITRQNLHKRRNKVHEKHSDQCIPRSLWSWSQQQVLADLEDELRRGTDVQTMKKYQKVSQL